MASLNTVLLIGNLTKDPEVRYTPSGTAVGDLRLAVTTKFKEREETCFVNVTVWDRQAETCSEYLSKGSPILVDGRLKFDEWERDGQKHSRISVVARRVQFLGSPRNAEYRDGPAPAPSPAPASAPQRPAAPTAPSVDVPPPNLGDTQDDDNLPF